jgi:hypothetical protein
MMLIDRWHATRTCGILDDMCCRRMATYRRTVSQDGIEF